MFLASMEYEVLGELYVAYVVTVDQDLGELHYFLGIEVICDPKAY